MARVWGPTRRRRCRPSTPSPDGEPDEDRDEAHITDDAETDSLDGIDGVFDLILANPPYIIDDSDRAYRDGGDMLGGQVSYDMAAMALPLLAPGGRMILYTGSAIVGGHDPLCHALGTLAGEQGVTIACRELDPDVFGEELAKPAYASVDRIALIAAIFTRAGVPTAGRSASIPFTKVRGGCMSSTSAKSSPGPMLEPYPFSMSVDRDLRAAVVSPFLVLATETQRHGDQSLRSAVFLSASPCLRGQTSRGFRAVFTCGDRPTPPGARRPPFGSRRGEHPRGIFPKSRRAADLFV